jgi:hypothetical protein
MVFVNWVLHSLSTPIMNVDLPPPGPGTRDPPLKAGMRKIGKRWRKATEKGP